MSELLLAPAAASNPASRPPSGASANAESTAATGPQASGKDQDAAQPAQASFASVLKKQMAQPQDAKRPPNGTSSAQSPLATDPIILAASTDTGLPAVDVSALAPFIEQLLPQLAKKKSSPEDAATSAASSADTLSPTLTAAPLTAALEMQQVAARQEAATLPTGPAEQRNTSAIDLVTTAAISADESAADIAAGGKTKGTGDFASLVSQASEQLAAGNPVSSTATTRTAAAPPLRMETPVGQTGWSNELGNKLTWMATVQRQQADLVLNPPQLGRVEISMTVTGDQATAVFSSASAEVRELLEDSLPRLREILSGAGINLGEAHVGSESANRFGNDAQKNTPSHASSDQMPSDMNTAGAVIAGSRAMSAGLGLVDTFA